MTPDELAAAGLTVAIDGPVATITLNRPEVRNAQHPGMWAAMVRILESLADEILVIVVRGAGGTFSAGLDLSLLDPAQAESPGSMVATMALSDQGIIDTIGTYQLPFAMLAKSDRITIAVIEGHAIGAGFQLALCCDLRIMADDARLCMKEVALGLVPDLVGTGPIVAAAGYARALELCVSARTITAAEAFAYGICQTVVPHEDLDDALTDLITSLTAHSAGAVRATKQLLLDAPTRTVDEQRLAERTAQVARFRAFAALLGP